MPSFPLQSSPQFLPSLTAPIPSASSVFSSNSPSSSPSLLPAPAPASPSVSPPASSPMSPSPSNPPSPAASSPASSPLVSLPISSPAVSPVTSPASPPASPASLPSTFQTLSSQLSSPSPVSPSYSPSPSPPVPSSSSTPKPPCNIVSQIIHTFYGFPDNNRTNSSDISYDCGRGNVAGGIGTYDNPLTFASSPAEFQRCEIIYDPYLRKYLRHEDDCSECNQDWFGEVWHIDVWVGSNSVSGGEDEIDCENRLTPPGRTQSVIRNSRPDLIFDSSPLYVPGVNGPPACNVDHVYPSYTPGNYC
ncbi:hypothetical protein BJX61DRAFT_499604 [Aspergillus egyptiacus]|nr:hypothetical protein BJX61DRAFT_499604 [Aspergillus egyptiacus]